LVTSRAITPADLSGVADDFSAGHEWEPDEDLPAL
jgi:hypothetical protein